MFKVSNQCCFCSKKLQNDGGLKPQILDGVEFCDSAGYNSTHDLIHFRIAICDDCLTKMMNKNLIQFEYREVFG